MIGWQCKRIFFDGRRVLAEVGYASAPGFSDYWSGTTLADHIIEQGRHLPPDDLAAKYGLLEAIQNYEQQQVTAHNPSVELAFPTASYDDALHHYAVLKGWADGSGLMTHPGIAGWLLPPAHQRSPAHERLVDFTVTRAAGWHARMIIRCDSAETLRWLQSLKLPRGARLTLTPAGASLLDGATDQ